MKTPSLSACALRGFVCLCSGFAKPAAKRPCMYVRAGKRFKAVARIATRGCGSPSDGSAAVGATGAPVAAEGAWSSWRLHSLGLHGAAAGSELQPGPRPRRVLRRRGAGHASLAPNGAQRGFLRVPERRGRGCLWESICFSTRLWIFATGAVTYTSQCYAEALRSPGWSKPPDQHRLRQRHSHGSAAEGDIM